MSFSPFLLTWNRHQEPSEKYPHDELIQKARDKRGDEDRFELGEKSLKSRRIAVGTKQTVLAGFGRSHEPVARAKEESDDRGGEQDCQPALVAHVFLRKKRKGEGGTVIRIPFILGWRCHQAV